MGPAARPAHAAAFAELALPASWEVVDFISDLHLQPSDGQTVAAWARFLDESPAQAIVILGDLFEVWVGDDAASEAGSFEQHCANLLRHASTRHALYFMAGNRDFLLGAEFAADAGLQLLSDPTVLTFGTERILLSHGDALCLDDADYMAFRTMVRGDAWRSAFLAQPLAQRRIIAAELRARSQARQRTSPSYSDLDATGVQQWLTQSDATTFVHGHTHRPATHVAGEGRRRIVLSDWDLRAAPPRAEVLRLTRPAGTGSMRVQRLPIGPN